MASTLKVQNIAHTGGTTAATIDSTGRILQPAIPAFAVRSDRAVTKNFSVIAENVPFNVIEFQRGGTVVVINGSGDNTSCVFTAPIAGIYQFNLVVNLTDAQDAWNSTYLYIDGASINSSNDDSYRHIKTNTNNYDSLSSSFLISLSANQTVTPKFNCQGDNSSEVRRGSRFSGFLVG